MTQSRAIKYGKIALLVLLVLVLLSFLASWLLVSYIRSHPEQVAERVEDYIRKNSPNADISIGEIDVAPVTIYPRTQIGIKEIDMTTYLADSSIVRHITLGNADIHFSLRELLRDRLKIDKVKIRDVVFDQTVDTILTKTPKSMPPKPIDNKAFSDKIDISIENFRFHIRDNAKNKNYELTANDLGGIFHIDGQFIRSDDVKLDIQVGELGFNLDNGAFLKNAHCRGNLKLDFDVMGDTINIPFFPMKINDQVFNVHTIISPVQNRFHFTIDNPKTDFAKTKLLLADNINHSLKPLDIAKEVDLHCTLDGTFEYRSIPLVEVYFETDNNKIRANGNQIVLNNADLKGKFVNKWYEESLESIESKKNFRVSVDYLDGDFMRQKIRITDTYFGQTDSIPGLVRLNLNAKGKPNVINELLDNPTFQFQNAGSYDLKGFFEGDFTDIPDLFSEMKLNFDVKNTKILYTPLQTIIPVNRLHLDKTKDDAFLHDLAIGLTRARGVFHMKGEIDNLTALVFDLNEKVKTNLEFTADKININYLLELLKRDTTTNQTDPSTTATSDQPRPLDVILHDIYTSFDPSIKINFDNVVYRDLVVDDVTANLSFEQDKVFSLSDVGFTYKNGRALTDMSFDLRDLQNQAYDLSIKSNDLNLWQILNDLSLNEVADSRKAEKIVGMINLDSRIKGVYRDSSGFDLKTVSALFDFDVNGLQFIGQNPINAWRKIDKIDTVSFDPIKNVITIEDQNIKIPEMHISGTEIDITMGGDFDYSLENVALSESQKSDEEGLEVIADFTLKVFGSPKRLNQLFNNVNFLFLEEGDFQFTSHLDGPAVLSPTLFDDLNTEFLINNANVLYRPLDLVFTVPEMNFILQNRDAILKNFVISTDETSHFLNLQGLVKNASKFFFGGEGKVTTDLVLSADYIDWYEFADLLQINNTDDKPKEEKVDTSQKSNSNQDLFLIMDMLYNTFDPTISINIGNYTYDKYSLDSVRGSIGFTNPRQIYIKNTGFDYGQGTVLVDLELTLLDSVNSEVGLQAHFTDINFKNLLQDFDYFGLPTLRNAKDIAGVVTIDTDLDAKINRYTGLYGETLVGDIVFQLDSFRLNEFEPLQTIGSKIFRKSRVQDVRFAPLSTTLHVENEKIYFPRTELISTAFDLFFEGAVGYNNDTNLWVAIPLRNLQRRKSYAIPDRNDNHYLRNKVFLNVNDSEGEMNYDLLFTNRKQFLQQGKTEEEWRTARKEMRKKKKEMRCEERRKRKDN